MDGYSERSSGSETAAYGCKRLSSETETSIIPLVMTVPLLVFVREREYSR